jgi:hypothetical protein
MVPHGDQGGAALDRSSIGTALAKAGGRSNARAAAGPAALGSRHRSTRSQDRTKSGEIVTPVDFMITPAGVF